MHAPQTAEPARALAKVLAIALGELAQGPERAFVRRDQSREELTHGILGEEAAVLRRGDEDHASPADISATPASSRIAMAAREIGVGVIAMVLLSPKIA